MKMAIEDAGPDIKDIVTLMHTEHQLLLMTELKQWQSRIYLVILLMKYQFLPPNYGRSFIGCIRCTWNYCMHQSTINDEIHPTINLENPIQCDLNYVPNKKISKKVKVALSNSFGFVVKCLCYCEEILRKTKIILKHLVHIYLSLNPTTGLFKFTVFWTLIFSSILYQPL